ncbi:MAG: hypothetical protein J6P61_08445 [Erysipelotrichaceae bacterium]|nr:hypothetical protein [Erysipelotrichaceae bacterium]
MVKKILSYLVIMVLFMASITACSKPSEDTKAETMSLSMSAAIDSVKLKWEKQDVDHYEICRCLYEEDAETLPVASDYETVAEVAADQTKYNDTTAEPGVLYCYIIRGYKEVNGKKTLAYTSFSEDSCEYECAGLGKPDLLNGGYGEFQTNTSEKLYLFAQCYTGIEPSKYIVYRKKSDETEFKELKRVNGTNEIVDDTVEAGVTYDYKIKGYKKIKDQTYESPESNVLTLQAVECIAHYRVHTVELTGEELTISIKSNKGNGDTIFYPKADNQSANTNDEDEPDYGAYFKQYSKDNKVWYDITKDGVTLKGGESIYLKLGIDKYKDSEEIGFTEEDEFVFAESEVNYKGSGAGHSVFEISLKDGTAKAYMEFD